VKPVPPDRLRDVVDAVLEALDEGLDGRALAARAMLSPFHFNRLVRAGIGEPPAAFRRRRRIRDRNEWDDVFVDALCTPPVSFTFGSVIAHILDISIVRRHMVIDVLRELGLRDVETRDPIEWERLIATRGEPRRDPCPSDGTTE
jgi:hypothetical protein